MSGKNIENIITQIGQDLIELKTGSGSRADSANWHKMVIDLGSIPIITDYSIRRIMHHIVVDAPSRSGTLLINPIVNPAMQYQEIDMGDTYVVKQYEVYGVCGLDFEDQRKISVYVEVGGLGASVVRNIQNLYLTLYSNYELQIISNTSEDVPYN